MPELRMAKASMHVKRHLTARELSTLRVALEVLLETSVERLDQATFAAHAADDGIAGDAEIRALIHELSIARKVKVCRTKTVEA